MSGKPDFVPAHRMPVWLSSVDVLNAIRRVGNERETDAARAVAWDMTQEIYKLVEAEDARSFPHLLTKEIAT